MIHIDVYICVFFKDWGELRGAIAVKRSVSVRESDCGSEFVCSGGGDF